MMYEYKLKVYDDDYDLYTIYGIVSAESYTKAINVIADIYGNMKIADISIANVEYVSESSGSCYELFLEKPNKEKVLGYDAGNSELINYKKMCGGCVMDTAIATEKPDDTCDCSVCTECMNDLCDCECDEEPQDASHLSEEEDIVHTNEFIEALKEDVKGEEPTPLAKLINNLKDLKEGLAKQKKELQAQQEKILQTIDEEDEEDAELEDYLEDLEEEEDDYFEELEEDDNGNKSYYYSSDPSDDKESIQKKMEEMKEKMSKTREQMEKAYQSMISDLKKFY